MKNNNYTSFFKTKPKKIERYIRCRKCGGNMEWVESIRRKSNVRSADIRYILSLMSQIVSNCQKHWKNILNYMRK